MPVSPLSPRAAVALADARPVPFWTDRPERPDPRAALTGAAPRTDLLVVGGGFTGLWAAIQAKEDDPSRDVVVVERGRFGIAASGRNGGFVASSLTHGLAQGLACWPDEVATLERLADDNRAGLEASLTTYGIDAERSYTLSWLGEERTTTLAGADLIRYGLRVTDLPEEGSALVLVQ